MDTVTSADGTTIAFDRVGHGPALILVGGAFQYRAFDPRTGQLAEQLGQHFTVYHYDRRGRGDSGDSPTTVESPVEREVEDLAALIDGAGGSAFLFGHSSGAILALTAVAQGLSVPRLALYEPPLVVDDSRPPAPVGYLARMRSLLADGAYDDAIAHFFTGGVGLPAQMVEQFRASPMWSGIKAVAPTLAYDAALTDGLIDGQPLPAQRWKSVTIPVLVANGGAGDAWMSSGADALAAVLADARRQTVPGQDHGPDPAVLAPVLTAFFAA